MLFNSLRTRLIVSFLLLTIGPLSLVGIWTGYRSATNLEQQSLALLDEIASRVTYRLEDFIGRRLNELRFIEDKLKLATLDKTAQKTILADLLLSTHDFQELALLEAGGQERIRLSRTDVILPSELANRAQADEFLLPMTQRGTYFGPVRFDADLREPLLKLALPVIHRRSGEVSYVLVAEIRFKKIWNLLAQLQLPGSTEVYVTNLNGSVVAHKTPAVVLKGTIIPAAEAEDHHALSPDQKDVIVAKQLLRLGSQSLIVLVMRPTAEALQLATSNFWLTLMITLIVLVITVLLALLLTSQLARPIEKLVATARAIGRNEPVHIVPDKGHDELSELTQAISQMNTMLRRRSQTLQISEQRFRDFASAGTDWLWETDASLRLCWMSENFKQATGQRQEEIFGKPFNQADTEHNLSNPGYRQYLNALQNHQPFNNVQVCRMTPSGPRWQRLSGVPIFDERGEFQGYRGTATDLTELRKLQQASEQQQQRLSQALELFDGLFVLFDADDRLLQWNREYQQVLEEQGIGHLLKTGVTFEALLDAQLERGQILDAVGREAQWRRWRLAQFQHPTQTFDVHTAANRWFQVSQQRLPDGTLLMAEFDIGARKQVENLMLQAKQEAERAALMKSQFLTTASHDLRQPLQGLRIFKDVLAMRFSDDSEVADILSECETALTAMEQLLRGYLDLSRLESGSVIPERENFPIQTLLQPIYNEFTVQAGNRQLQLRLVNSSAVIYSDRTLLGQILRNLVANAVRYTQTGKILIGVRRCGDHLSLQVWDTGPGISEDQQSKIFKEFYQIDNPARNQSDGYGIGLAIVNMAARLLGHRIHMASQPGKGTLFSIEVPLGNLSGDLAIPISAAVTSIHTAAVVAKTVLIVEDDSTIRHSLTLFLRRNGFLVNACENGEQALPQLMKNTPLPDRIITDFWLPGAYTGLKWLETLKRVLPADIEVIVITGDTSPDTHQAIEATGCTLQIKPVQTQKLLELLQVAAPAALMDA